MATIYFVYLLTFAGGKVYVGMSKTDKRGRYTLRYNNHALAARNGKELPIYNAWRKHGAPVQSILSTHVTRDECALAEIDAIQAYDSMNSEHGYNLAAGGQGMHAPPGSAMYDIMRARVWNNPEKHRKVSEKLKGRPVAPETRAAQLEWCRSEAGRAKTRELTARPEVREKMSAIAQRRLDSGLREHLTTIRAMVKPPSPEGAARGAAKRRAWLDSDHGKATVRKGMQAMRANPENEVKRKAAIAIFANSEANKAHCAAMSAKSRKAVKDLNTGTVYESRAAAARALNVTGPTVGYWIKQGKFAYV